MLAHASRSLFPGGILGILALLPAAVPIRAQVAGSVSGYVRDQSGAEIPSVSIAARSAEQQLTRTTVTDNTGFYNLLVSSCISSGTTVC